MEIKICHIYPDVLNLYGDRGNVICMEKRLQWRGIETSVTKLPMGECRSLADYDIIFIGGGQGCEEQLLDDLHRGKDREIISALEDGKCFLTICGGFQLMGSYSENLKGERFGLLGAVDFYSREGRERMTGDFKFRCTESSGGSVAVGFENHSARTYLGKGIEPLGTVISGHGNNGEDGTEGVRYKNLFGSYSHGPLLPKNPELCDFILLTALKRKYGSAELAPLDDRAEQSAHDYMCGRL
ncbi:MAG: type 1 glutamine amidotransferase [Candidatus Limivicinus sp.]|jgi:CobQ-like glutamine amidotransferase family enzyme